MRRPRPFLRAHRLLPRRRPDPSARAAGVAAVAVELERRPTADDVARILRGRSDFPRVMIAAEAVARLASIPRVPEENRP